MNKKQEKVSNVSVAGAFFLLVFLWLLCMPYGSFFLDPGLLILSGCLIVWVTVRILYKKFGRRKFIPLFSFITIMVFYIISIGLYFNASWLSGFVNFCSWLPLFGEARSGYDWMINSGVFSLTEQIDPNNSPFYVHLLAGFLYTLYPLWLYLGVRLGYILFGKTEYQTGVVSLLF